MPIYEYRCPNGHLFELFQRIGDALPEKCEVCGEGPVERVLYPVAVHFKGSGFYTTDYGRRSRGKESAPKESSSPDGGAGGESKPDSKPKEKAAEA